jgi:hypothetical protein
VVTESLSENRRSELRTLVHFVSIYCRERHGGVKAPYSTRSLDITEIERKKITLCPECARLLTYGIAMRLKCPHDPKPMCKKCDDPCYRGEYKTRIRDVMKFSGMYLVRHGRLDLLYHFFR